MRPGYSGKELIDKLGYLAGDSVYIHNALERFKNCLKENGVTPVSNLPATWAHAFFTSKFDLEKSTPSLFQDRALEKGIWVSWPKKSSGIKTDLTEQTFRDVILPTGWVDTKIAAIDETWSGLKFLRRR